MSMSPVTVGLPTVPPTWALPLKVPVGSSADGLAVGTIAGGGAAVVTGGKTAGATGATGATRDRRSARLALRMVPLPVTVLLSSAFHWFNPAEAWNCARNRPRATVA